MTDVPEPKPGPGELLLKVLAASVCGSDIHLYDWDPFAASHVKTPRVVGHEICGEVVAYGEGADGPALGTRVAVESHVVCGTCKQCLRGDFHVCAKTQILGFDRDGGFTEYVTIPVRNAYPVGEQITPEMAAAMEPFGNAVHACSVRKMEGSRVAVFGCGPIGCASVAVAKARGAERVVAVDRDEYRLGLAESMGADATVLTDGDDTLRLIHEAAGGEIDCALEMSGAVTATNQSIEVLRPGGWISLMGLGPKPVTIDVSNMVVMKGITMYGIVGRVLPDTWRQTTEYLNDGTLDPRRLITHHFSIEDIEEVVQLVKSGKCGKVSLHANGH